MTRSKALAKSKNIATHSDLQLLAALQSSMTSIMASMVLLFGRKPYCLFVFQMLLVMLSIYFTRICWKTFSKDERFAIGRKSDSPLGIGVKFALFHCDGTVMELRQRRKRSVICATISRLASLLSPGPSPSGPASVRLSRLMACPTM